MKHCGALILFLITTIVLMSLLYGDAILPIFLKYTRCQLWSNLNNIHYKKQLIILISTKTIFTKYWNDYNEFIQELKSPLDLNWIFRAIHYFGFTFRGLSNKAIKKDIISTPDEIYQIYLSNTETNTFTNKDLIPYSKTFTLGRIGDDLRKFWRFSHKIGNDSNTIHEWTEVFTGTNTSSKEIENYLQKSLYLQKRKSKMGK